MATKIRLARGGAKKRPFYRIVVADVRAPRDGRFIEKLGTYNPMLPKESKERLVLNEERIKHWLGAGATPTDRVESFLVAAGLFKRNAKRQKLVDQRIAAGEAKKAEKKAQADAEAKAKAEEEAKAAAEAKAAEEAAAAEAAAAEAPAEEAPAEEAKEA